MKICIQFFVEYLTEILLLYFIILISVYDTVSSFICIHVNKNCYTALNNVVLHAWPAIEGVWGWGWNTPSIVGKILNPIWQNIDLDKKGKESNS
jgi:hypothetical protein